MAPKRSHRPRSAPIEAPSWLGPEAAEVYRRAAAQAPDADPDALCVYACAVADFHQAQDLLNRSGPVVQGAKGLVRNPLQAVKQANAAAVRQLAKDLGLIGPEDVPPPPPPRRYRNQRATEATITSLRRLGRIEPVDEANIALARTIATALDQLAPDDPSIGTLARTQLQALRMLRGTQDDSATALAALLASVSAEMGDAPES